MLNALFHCRQQAKKKVSPLSEEEYETHISEILVEWKKRKMDKKKTAELLTSSFQNRRHWINDKMPHAAEVLEKFPVFDKTEFVSFLNNIQYCIQLYIYIVQVKSMSATSHLPLFHLALDGIEAVDK
jgi:hypothetical protein